jgi:DNA-binding XRE family transcriptional regulator
MENSVVVGLDQLIAALRIGDIGGEEFPPSPDEIRALRQASGLSRGDFCVLIGISLDTLKSWEIGRRTPSRIASRVLKSHSKLLISV